MKWEKALSTGPFFHIDIFKLLSRIHKAGFSRLEIMASPLHFDPQRTEKARELADRAGELGMEIISFHAPFSRHIDLSSPDPKIQAASIERMLICSRAASVAGAKYLIVHPAPDTRFRPEPDQRALRLLNCAESVNRIAEHSAEGGVKVLVENMPPGTCVGSLRDILWIQKRAGSENVGFCLDTGHANISGDLIQAPALLSHALNEIHLSDNNGKEDQHQVPGAGTIDWEGLKKQLRLNRFSGEMVLELSPEAGSVRDMLRKGRDSMLILEGPAG